MEAQTTTRPAARSRLPRPAPSPGFLDSVVPYNPYILPKDPSAKAWAVGGLLALGLSLSATLLWDRGPHIATSKGGFMQAPAQWVSSLALTVVAVVGAFALGAPWGALPLVAAVFIALRRILAADGRELGVVAALAGATRKFVLAGAGIAAWFGSVAIAGWLNDFLSQVSLGPIGRVGGESASQSMSTAGERLIGCGSIASIVVVTVAALWWAHDVYLNQMDPTPE